MTNSYDFDLVTAQAIEAQVAKSWYGEGPNV
jgi:hypothetical protein